MEEPPDIKKKREKWTLERVLKEAKEIHGDKYDLSLTKEIKTQNSNLIVKCKQCSHIWFPPIGSFITKKHGCSNCNGGVGNWTYERFMEEAKEIHGDKYNLSLVKSGDIENSRSRAEIICNICQNKWNPSIFNFIYKKSGCSICNVGEKWTYNRFMKEAKEIHGDKYDYSLIKEDIKNSKSEFEIICDCGNKWKVCLQDHIYNKTGCTNCQSSKGEKECKRILNEIFKLKCKTQVYFEEYKNLRYDIQFMSDGEGWMLEFDGRQHFEIIEYFKMTQESFLAAQQRDIIKTRNAIEFGYNVIRIDYNQIKNIEYHIRKALKLGKELYISNEEMYKWLVDRI